MLSKASALPADQIFLDLEDSVAPSEKPTARENVISALENGDWSGKTVGLRINAIDTQWGLEDLLLVVGAAARYLDCIIVPKVQHPEDVKFVDRVVTALERKTRRERPIGIEALIESATALRNIYDIAHSSDRLETLILGPADMSASLGLPTLDVGLPMPGYPGDHWHWVLETILIAARDARLQAIDGPYLLIKDLEGLRQVAMRARALGYDGKWALHPLQVDVLNDVFTPTQDEFDKAEALLAWYKTATEVDHRGAVMFGEEMIDEASRKMAEQFARRGRAAGMKSRGRAEGLAAGWQG